MAKIKRTIIKIDEEKCNGCGLCVPACAEGAIQIIDGKARLVKEEYCDGLGACLGECPQDALTIEEREVEEFDEEAVETHLNSLSKSAEAHHHSKEAGEFRHDHVECPSAMALHLHLRMQTPPEDANSSIGVHVSSQLQNWPVQIALVPPNAPYFEKADLLIAADCVPFAYANFHQELLKDKIVIVGCPKLDDFEMYQKKFTRIFRSSDIHSITIAHMEVPCCFGLSYIVQEALSASGKDIPVHDITIGINGNRR